jgi:L-seryl-tRNA(Ser) seleniumtransferase
MKVGKEGMAGAIAALEAWERRDHAAVRAVETAALHLWQQRLAGRSGVTATIMPDPTDNPLDRLMLAVDPTAARITAWDLADRLAAGPVPVIVRDHELEQGFFFMDPCNLHPGEAEIVAGRLAHELEQAQRANDIVSTNFAKREASRESRLLIWPD